MSDITNFSIAKPALRAVRDHRRWLRIGYFPLAVLAFSGVGVRYFNSIFTTSSRWIFLALLIAALVPGARILSSFKFSFGVPFSIYLTWCVFTSIWSDVPELSLLKSVALVMLSVALVSGGYFWTTKFAPNEMLQFLVPIVLVAVAAGGGGVAEPKDVSFLENDFAYGGLAGNPNYFGTLIAIASPFSIFLVYRAFYQRRSGVIRLLALGLAVMFGVMLARSGSRSSMLSVATTIYCAMMALGMNKRIMMIGTSVFALVSVLLVVPQVQQQLYERYILKGGTEQDGVFFSRYQPWQDSYDAALQGGYGGLGYGVTAGKTNFQFGLTAQTYGREKGNAQLAVWEETGLVGLALYAMLLFAIFKSFYRAFRKARGELKVLIASVGGVAMGLTVQSVFEAWWTAPGSIQSAAFWAFVGVGAGLVRQIDASRREARAVVGNPRPAQVVLPQGSPDWRGSAAS